MLIFSAPHPTGGSAAAGGVGSGRGYCGNSASLYFAQMRCFVSTGRVCLIAPRTGVSG